MNIKRVKNNFIKLADKKSWNYDKESLDSIKIGKYTRSIYLHVKTAEGQKAFFKMPLEKRAKNNMKREIAYLRFVNKNAPNIAPQIIDYNIKWKRWSLVEEIPISKGYIPQAEKTEPLKPSWLNWLITSLSHLEQIEKKEKIPKSLEKIGFRKMKHSKAKFYESRLLFHLSKLNKNTDRFPEISETTTRIASFLEKNRNKIKKSENKGKRLIHGDFAPNNVFFNIKDKNAVFLDWEWASVNTNSMIGPAFDFANMYLRLWQNKAFQKRFLEKYLSENLAKPDQIKTSVSLFSVGQLRISDKDYKIESGIYLKKHLKALSSSVNKILDL